MSEFQRLRDIIRDSSIKGLVSPLENYVPEIHKLLALESENRRLREALQVYASCSDGCTCGDGWNHDTAKEALHPTDTEKGASK